MPNLARGISPGRAPTKVPVQSAPKPNIGPWKEGYGQKPAPKVFAAPLKTQTKQNIKTGAYLQAYRATPQGQKAAQRNAPKPNWFQSALKTVGHAGSDALHAIGEGEHAVVHVGSDAIHAIEEVTGHGSNPLHTSSGLPGMSSGERKAQAERYASTGVQALEAGGLGGIGKAALRGAGAGLKELRAAHVERAALEALGGKTPSTAQDLAALKGGSRTLGIGGRVAKGGSNLLAVTAPVAKGQGITEAAQLGSTPIIGAVRGTEAAIAGAKGNWGPAKEFGKALTEGAVGEALQGHLGKAEKLAKERPELAVLEAAGVTTVGGRLTGASLRAAGSTAADTGLRGGLARAGSTVRSPLALSDEPAVVKNGYYHERKFSKDSTRKAAQIAADRRLEPLVDAQGKVVTVKQRGREVPVLKPSKSKQETLQRNRANYESGATNATENLARHRVVQQVHGVQGAAGNMANWLRPMRAGQMLTRMVAGGIIRTSATFPEDIAKFTQTVRDSLKHPEYYTKDELTAAKQNLESLEKIARNPRIARAIPKIVEHGIEYGRALHQGDIPLQHLGIHSAEELAMGKHSEYAFAHMKAQVGDNGLHINGAPLTVEQIQAHAALYGRPIDTIGYLPHTVGSTGGRFYHQPFQPGSRPVAPGLSRTGVLQKRGAIRLDSPLIRDELTRKAVTANNAQSIDTFIKNTAVVRPDGQAFTPKEAAEYIHRAPEDLVAVRMHGALDQETQNKIKEFQNPAAMEAAHRSLLLDRIVSSSDKSQTRNVGLVPATHLEQLMKHLAPSGQGARIMQMVQPMFRTAVLPQPKWLTGNIFEPMVVRLPLSGAGINIPGSIVDMNAAGKVVKDMYKSANPEVRRAADIYQAMHEGGMLIGRRGASTYRTYRDLTGKPRQVIQVGSDFRHLPAVKQLGDLALSIPKGMFAINRFLEGHIQKIALGKSIRDDVHEFTGSWLKTLKLGQDAVKEVQKGMVNTATQHRFMEEQYKLLGQYAGFNPLMRKATQTLTPFIPWTLNALRFVYWTMPTSHTAALAALATASTKMQAEWQTEHEGVPPGALQYALPSKGGWTDIAKYTPYGASIPVSEGDVTGIVSQVAPQFQGSIKNLEGRDAFGRTLEVPKTASNPKGIPTQGQKNLAAANSLAGSLIWPWATVQRVREGGGTPYATSTPFNPQTKPETKHQSGWNRTFNPLRPIYVKKTKKEGGRFGEGASKFGEGQKFGEGGKRFGEK